MRKNQLSKKVVVVGTGGHAKEIDFLCSRNPNLEIVGYYTDDDSLRGEKFLGKEIIGSTDDLLVKRDSTNAIIAIADPLKKKQIVQKLKQNSNIFFPTIIDSTALIGIDINMSEGNVILANVTMTHSITLGSFNMINIGSSIGHDDKIGDFNSIFPHVSISGNVTIGNFNSIGVGTKIIQGLDLGDANIIGAGSVVIRCISNRSKQIGVPAKEIERL